MAFKKGQSKPSTSGRKKGVKNKKTLLKVEEFLAIKNVHPVEELVRLLPKLDPADAAKTLLELLKFIQPQLKPSDTVASPNPDPTIPVPKPATTTSTADLLTLVKKP